MKKKDLATDATAPVASADAIRCALGQAGIIHCWESCCEGKLLTAWDVGVQATIVSQKYFLFPKTAPALEATESECTSTGAGSCEDYDEEGEEAAFIDEILEYVDEDGNVLQA